MTKTSKKFQKSKTKLVVKLDFGETYTSDFERFARCQEYIKNSSVDPDTLMFDLNIFRLNLAIQESWRCQIKPSFNRVAQVYENKNKDTLIDY